ncbi:SurA N-terminal domain-containing protein [Methylomarinum sp. Ch1-1]|uniref:Periplasmic chaperone PpiD n=1 Tax=Methylomarinum roseum TaxID=3067653 RepID=A0AAU7NZL2_9GAMM|nr:SurA N-terminal domain-containing protein [Methylomarinum sp. Ch1-1]MDP4521552.1 SurA N-terminal domain-containing protein [Methylomarinum sp. Ch1-1]
MLQKIRDKSQGVFAWVILILICVPFALWGIQNYLGGGKEAPIASVGDKEFYQQDLSRAYSQYAQNLAGMNFDEEVIKQQAFNKLIRDEVLHQHVRDEGLVVTDQTARDFIKSLDYFQTDGKFDKQQYKALLGSQRMSSAEFVDRIKKALVMEQYQKAITDSSFVTQGDIDRFFAIQNQTRDIAYLSVPLKDVTEQPSAAEIEAYYQQHQAAYRTEEQVAIAYLELSLDKLAADIDASEEQLKSYYQERKDLYTTKERRRISHMLFAFADDADDEETLQRALKAKQRLQSTDFATLAAEVSDDKLTAKKGGDLGLFNVGVMEKAFEEAATSLELGEVSEPVKSEFGYHLIKVTELVPGEVKPYDSVKTEIAKAYKKAQAETRFYELGETLAEVSYENPGSLQAASEALGLTIQKTGLFSRNAGEGVAEQEAVRNAAFSEEVLKGNNSEPVEIGTDKLIVLRMLEHKPATVKEQDEIKPAIITAIQAEKAREQAKEKAAEIKSALLDGQSMAEVAETYRLKVNTIEDLKRNSKKLSWPVTQAVFKAAKPMANKPTVIVAADPDGSQNVVSITAVTEGEMSESDKQKQQLAEKNIANAFGQNTFNAVLSNLEAKADISIRPEK